MPSVPTPPVFSSDVVPDTVEVNLDRDRRAFKRAHLSLHVTLAGENGLYAGITNDISQGGVFVELQFVPAIGTEVELQIDLNDGGELLSVYGRVQWRRVRGPGIEGTQGIGVSFGDLSEQDLERLQVLLQERDSLLWEP